MKHTEETKQKMRDAWAKRRDTFVPPMKDKKMSAESRQKMSDAAKARPSNRTGMLHTAETRAKISQITRERTARGESHYAYKDGQSVRRTRLRQTTEYYAWRKAVFERDGFTCQHCGDAQGGNLHPHHIKGFAEHPDFRYDVDNGITLCQSCHEKVHGKGIGKRLRPKPSV